MDKFIKNIDATPEKRSFFSIVNDYDLKLSICELIDNSIDHWDKSNSSSLLCINIELDKRQQTILFTDNAGGVTAEGMRLLVCPGASSNSDLDNSIGIFGVGSKRAIVALSENTKILSHHIDSPDTHLVEITTDWLQEDSWNLPLRKTRSILAGNTELYLSTLRKEIEENSESILRGHLGQVYSKYLTERHVSIVLNNTEISPLAFDTDWAYPDSNPPQSFNMHFLVEENRSVKARITGGLLKEGCAGDGRHGVYLYCNKRLIVKAERSPEVGYVKSNAGSSDHLNSMRVIVELEGPAKYMPWDSSKSRFNYHNESFKLIQKKIIELTTYWVKVSRSFERSEGGWKDNVFPYKNGELVTSTIDVGRVSINKYLMPIITSKKKFSDTLKSLNKEVVEKKKYTRGLYETIITYKAIQKLDISQKNRVLLIILDSSLEIGFKEFLVYEAPDAYSEDRLKNIFKDRNQVHLEIQKHTNFDQDLWNSIRWYYNHRCDLIHKKASTTLNDDEVDDFRKIVEHVFNELFGLKFS
ncbi:histidine kinase/DNA gyrase B/HSP90-like ATPase [Roseivirga ehrenbergii]|uniref:ATP-binding protein n=1 Tax=Roseivirga ehrenbergii (strain DSM 102268 / JCM 13514 / KCTC 12282 / NCIMB 14502 / KMM 6017) TaxID=279360 RepID=A0A150XSG7_ROSEK|nr:ATP-binding protein [Roseivirga ehrenbergii]KYG81661.1 hypothetical protein MB14_13850 [Roseivirga ehrenbergii]TCL10836.1 histidine kinase/DNA gyrase B/HSP90-like ATPase [Roseivirga ehrenbergii]